MTSKEDNFDFIYIEKEEILNNINKENKIKKKIK